MHEAGGGVGVKNADTPASNGVGMYVHNRVAMADTATPAMGRGVKTASAWVGRLKQAHVSRVYIATHSNRGSDESHPDGPHWECTSTEAGMLSPTTIEEAQTTMASRV